MSEPQWIWQCDRTIPSETGAGRQILDEVLLQLQAQRWSPHDIFSVHLAMHEALVNAIMHGNRLDAAKRVHVDCRIAPELVRIEIADEGEGFRPNHVPNPTDPDRIESPNGRGVMLMKAFMSQVDYSERGNCVVLQKRRSEQDGPLPPGNV
jgi:serine/threonine-protein kinase RsbW